MLLLVSLRLFEGCFSLAFRQAATICLIPNMSALSISGCTDSVRLGTCRRLTLRQVLIKASFLSLASLSLIGAAKAAGAGPSGRYYVTDESGFNKIWQFQGSSLSSFPTVPSGGADGPIIVDGNTNTVRSVKGGFSGGSPSSPGSEYDFAGNVLSSLSLDFSSHLGYGRVIDAAFDGKDAYIVAGSGGPSGVFRYGPNFSGSGTLLFNITDTSILPQGITYDTKTNTLWTSDYNKGGSGIGFVRQWDMSGNQLSSFRVIDNNGVDSERNTALAYDFSDDTFWLNAHVENTLGYGIGELWQFDRNGNFLQSIHGRELDSNAPQDILYWGGEIRATGEPPTAPGPLPALGVAAAFSCSRSLRRRIQSGNTTGRL